MRFWYVANKRQSVLDKTILTMFGVTLLVILVYLLPREDQFKSLLARGSADLVALRYAELMSHRDPDNAEMRFLLANQYYNLGRLRDALRELRAADGTSGSNAQLLQLKILQQLFFGSASGYEKRTWRQWIDSLLTSLGNEEGLTPRQRHQLISSSLGFGKPAVAALQYAWLARNGDPSALGQAGQYSLAAGQPKLAASFYREAILSGQTNEVTLTDALTAYRLANELEEGNLLIRAVIDAGRITPNNLLPAMQYLQASNGFDILRQLISTSANMDLPVAMLLQWVRIATAVGELDIAVARVPTLLAEQPNSAEVHLLAAQLFAWTDQGVRALPHWQWLAVNAPDLVDPNTLWRTANGLFRYDIVIEMLSRIEQERELDTVEYEAFIRAFLELGEPDGALAVIERFLDQYPTDRKNWLRAATLLEADERFADALDWWARLETHIDLTTADHRSIARLHWKMFDLEGALVALARIDTEAVRDDPEYWAIVGKLAYDLGEYDLSAKSLLALADITELNKTQLQILLGSLDEDQSELRFEYALKAWYLTQEPEYLLIALEAATDDEDKFRQILALANQDPSLFGNVANFWLLKAQFHQNHAESDLAWAAYQQAYQITPFDTNTMASILWFLLVEQRMDELRRFTGLAGELVTKAPDLAHPYAAALARLNEHRLAAVWFERAHNHRPEEPELALDYADALLAAGLPDAGYRLRQHILNKTLAGLYELDSLNGWVLQRVSAQLLTQPQFRPLILSAYDRDPTSVVNALLQGLLESRHVEGLTALTNFADANNLEVDPYFRYYLDLQHRDLEALRKYYGHSSIVLATEAPQVTGDTPMALYEAINGLNESEISSERDLVRRVAADLLHDKPYGWQSRWHQRDLGSVELEQAHLRYAVPLRDWHIDTTIFEGYLDTSQALGIPGRYKERLFQTTWSHPKGNGEWQLTMLAGDSEQDDWVGAKASRTWKLDNHIDVRAFAGYGELADQSSLLRSFGLQDQVGVQFSHRISPMDVWTTQLKLNQFRDRYGAGIGSGVEWQLSYEHYIFYDNPSVRLLAGGSIIRNQRDALGQDLSNLLNGRDPNDLLPDTGGRVGVGLIIERGDPLRMNRRLPSPHYRMAVTTGVAWPSQNTTLNVEASLGIRIFGEDLLALQFDYESQPQAVESDAATSWSVIYSHRLGK